MNDNTNFASILATLLLTDWPKSSDLESLSEKFTKDLLVFASETPDNLNCAAYIELGRFNIDNKKKYGLKIKDKNIPISTIMNIVENLTLPQEVKENFPDLKEEEWDATTRIVTLILIALQK